MSSELIINLFKSLQNTIYLFTLLIIQMKHIPKDPEDLILRKALFLAFGIDDVDSQDPPRQLLSWKVVSNLLKQPYNLVMKLKREFFNPSK